ncbi:MAG TPA: ATP-binding protein [Pyrinomonadaceae bacterium]|jgi:hypothetical protein|nr:ATP-binding protein [Pyrinomonadaceae bacterium]
MSAHPAHDWHSANQQLLLARLASVREALARYVEREQGAGEEARGEAPAEELGREASAASEGEPESSAESESVPSALDALCAGFGLSPFERDVLLMCAGVELDASFAALCATAQGEGRRGHPTFGLALAALPGAHWSALSPAAPLRYWRLVEVEPGQHSLTQARVRIDERVLHHLTGVNYLDERLWGLFHPVSAPDVLPPSHGELAERLARLWSEEHAEPAHPLVALGGEDPAGKRAVAAAVASMFGFDLWAIDSADVPQQVAEREALARLWNREAVLRGSALLLDADGAEAPHAVTSFAESVRGMAFFASRDTPRLRRRLFAFEVKRPSAAEQQMLWRSALGPASEELNGALETLISNFSLGAEGIHAAAAQARESFEREGEVAPAEALWSACRVRGRAKLDDLAQRIEPAAGWEDIVLPDYQLRTLRELAAHVRQRATVYERWGFASRGARGLGISALFSGPSGTGKTMAAEVLAGDLRLDLYRIDLSSVVSKYIGETEKNLRRVFDAAEESGAVLLFDEADALFGKRSEVKDSHDRYANIEVSYLLQRMEAYRGLAILTTNLKTALDHSFMRRLRFVVHFPFPDAAQRAEIWRRVFPPDTPTAGLQYDKLARLNVAGGNIRNIALNAAFIAADAGQAVSMAHLLQAAGSEYEKLEKPLTGAESGGWL